MKSHLLLHPHAVLPSTTSLPDSFLHHMLDALADVVCAFDENGYCKYVNKSSRQLWGYEPEEIIGINFLQFVFPEDIAKTIAYCTQSDEVLRSSGFTNRVYKKDGTLVTVHWSGKWVATDGLHYCTATDGTKLHEAEERLEKAQKLARVANFEFDLVANVYTYTSDTMFTIFGLDRRVHPVFTRELFWKAVHPDDLEFVKKAMLHPEHTYQVALEYRIVQPGGDVVYIKRLREVIKDSEGKPLKTIGTLQDVTDRKKTELALIQSSKRLKALVENGSDLICIIDSAGNYIYVAESVQQILGYEPDELVGKNAFLFIHPDDHHLAATALAEVTSNRYMKLQPYRFKNKAGSWRWLESKAANFTDDASIHGLIVNSQDITEQKAQQDKIRELSIIACKINQLIVLSDKEHRITWLNQAFTDLSEYTLEEVAGKKVEALFWADGQVGSQCLEIQHQLQRDKTIVTELLFTSKSGKQHWIEWQLQTVYNDEGDFVQFLGIGKDITERKKIDAQLALSEEKFKTLVQNGSDLIVIVDAAGNFKYISENVRELLNYEPESLIGRNAFDLIPLEEREFMFSELQRIQGDESLTKGVQHRFLKADGSWIWLESKGCNHLNNKAVEGILINARDITDRVKLQIKLDKELCNRQKELTTAVINAQEQERSQLGLELHDNVNQVLTTVKLYNEMFLSGYGEDKELIKKSTIYLQECINEIRSISKRLSAPTLGHISLHDSVQELIDSLIVTRQLEILFRPYNIEQLCISKELHLTIYRIIQEGLNNIIKYAEATTAIVSIRYYEKTLNVTIYDDGKGFDTNKKRSGIGITNMRTRAENMNGTFELNSTPGHGCAIKMVFPLPDAH